MRMPVAFSQLYAKIKKVDHRAIAPLALHASPCTRPDEPKHPQNRALGTKVGIELLRLTFKVVFTNRCQPAVMFL